MLALLFAIENFCTRHTDRSTAVGTDAPCEWDRPRTASHPARVADVQFSSFHQPSCLAKLEYNPGPKPDFNKLSAFWKTALEGTNAVARQMLNSAPEPLKELPDLRALIQQSQQHTGDFDAFMSGILNQSLPQQVESRTRGQAENPVEWMRQRHGRITGSQVHQAAHYTGETVDNYVVAGILGLREPMFSRHLEYGRVTENVARQLYYDQTRACHTKFHLRKSGFVLSKVDWRF